MELVGAIFFRLVVLAIYYDLAIVGSDFRILCFDRNVTDCLKICVVEKCSLGVLKFIFNRECSGLIKNIKTR